MKSDSTAPFPWKAVIITVLVTMLIMVGAAYFSGVHLPHMLGPAPTGNGVEMGEPVEDSLYTCSMHPFIITKEPGTCPVCAMDLVPREKEEVKDPGDRKVAYWRAPMNPAEVYDQPGKSAMGMDLVPVYEDELIGGVEISIDPVVVQNMGLRTSEVKRMPLVHTIRTFGHVTYDETRVTRISPRFSGWLEKVFVNFAGQAVEKGTPLFRVYSPELVSAQEEYLGIFRNRGGGMLSRNMLASVRSRLLNYSLTPGDIRRLERDDRASGSIVIRSPFKGVVIGNNAVKGEFFKAGSDLFTIADLSRVWVEAHIYEYELNLISPGLDAEMTLPYNPGKIYPGEVTFIYPLVQKKTRDVIVRLEFENPGVELMPDMYADVRINTGGDKVGMAVPSEAVLRSGEKNIVFVSRGGGKFTPRNVVPGSVLDDGNIHILSGLAPGEVVVTSGQFMLDSESKLREAVQKMMEAGKPGPEPEEPEDDFFEGM